MMCIHEEKELLRELSDCKELHMADTCLYIVYIEFLYPCGLVLAWFIQCRRRRIVGWRVFFLHMQLQQCCTWCAWFV